MAGAEEQRSLKNHSYSDVLLAAIRGFQVESNTLTSFRAAQREAAAVSEFTREDGHLDPMTLNALRQRYAECETRLRDVKGVTHLFQPLCLSSKRAEWDWCCRWPFHSRLVATLHRDRHQQYDRSS